MAADNMFRFMYCKHYFWNYASGILKSLEPEKKIPWRKHPVNVTRNSHLSANAYRLWSVLRSHEGKDGIANPGKEVICRDSNLNTRTIIRAERELIGLGMLDVVFKPRGKNQGNAKYRTKEGDPNLCQKCPAYENKEHQSIPGVHWYEAMDKKHDCGGCGWCFQCRSRDGK